MHHILLVLRMLCKECYESYFNRFRLLMWTGETIHIRFVWTRFSLKTEIWMIHVDRTKDN